MSAPSSFLGYQGFRHLKLSLLVLTVAVAVYALYDPLGGRSGNTLVGYGLGAFCAALILWLLWFGVRKRSYSSTGADLRGWLSAHVYLGVTLLLLVPLHSAFQFGWNVHTLAYALLVVVVVSGICGVIAYALVPELMTRNRAGQRSDALMEEIADVDADCRNLAGDLPDAISRAIASAIDDTRIGGSLARKLRGYDPRCATTHALGVVRGSETEDAAQRDQVNQVIELLARKAALLTTVRTDVRHRALLDLWLLFHVPLSLATLAAVVVHVFVVFYYW